MKPSIDEVNDITKETFMKIMKSSDDWKDRFVILEGIVAGVITAHMKLGKDEAVLDILVNNVKTRMAEMRLKNLTTGGTS